MSFLKYQKQNPTFLNDYLKYQRYIAGYSEMTVNEYYYDLRTFFRFLRAYNLNILDNISKSDLKKIEIKTITIKELNMVTENIIDNFIIFLNYNLCNIPKTRNRKLASLKRFFEYLSNNNLISNNPAKEIHTAKIEVRVVKPLSIDESKKILSKIITSNQRFKIRNYAIACIFLNCSIRLSELISINVSDLKMNEKTIKIHGKGNVERIIYMDDAVFEAITEYLKVRPHLNNIYQNALFISERNKRISKRCVQSIIKDVLDNIVPEERKKKIHIHTLRHTSASLMYNNNTDIFVIKKILGHKSLVATQLYTHVSDERMKNLIQNYGISSILEKEGVIL